MFQYFHFAYCLQEELTHCDLRVSTHFSLEVLVQFAPKDHTKKAVIFTETFRIIPILNAQHSMSNFLNISIMHAAQTT